MDILKDAAATAHLRLARVERRGGDHHQAGGSEGRTSVTFNSYIGSQSASKRVSLLTGPEYQEFFQESAINDGDGEKTTGSRRGRSVSEDWQDAVLRSAPVGTRSWRSAAATSG